MKEERKKRRKVRVRKMRERKIERKIRVIAREIKSLTEWVRRNLLIEMKKRHRRKIRIVISYIYLLL